VAFISTKPLCGEDVLVRLGGLTEGKSFQLRSSIGCNIEIEKTCDDKEFIRGRVVSVGSEFLEINQGEGPYVTVPFSRFQVIPEE
jgi:small-conductance mechanosensitive channel